MEIPPEKTSSILVNSKDQKCSTCAVTDDEPHQLHESSGDDLADDDDDDDDSDANVDIQKEEKTKLNRWRLEPPPQETFQTYEAASNFCNWFGRLHGYKLVVQKTRKNDSKIYERRLQCSLGPIRIRKISDEARIRKKRSKKLGCEMGLRIKFEDKVGWHIQHFRGDTSRIHNHEPMWVSIQPQPDPSLHQRSLQLSTVSLGQIQSPAKQYQSPYPHRTPYFTMSPLKPYRSPYSPPNHNEIIVQQSRPKEQYHSPYPNQELSDSGSAIQTKKEPP